MLNDNIRTVRKNRGFTQEDLASRLHVTRQTVSKWEKGISVPDAEMLTRLAEELDTDFRVISRYENGREEMGAVMYRRLVQLHERKTKKDNLPEASYQQFKYRKNRGRCQVKNPSAGGRGDLGH